MSDVRAEPVSAQKETKKMFSVRLPLQLIERLDQARWQLRLDKTTITRRALEQFLDKLLPAPKETIDDAGT